MSKSGIKIIDDIRVTVYQDDKHRYIDVISEKPRTMGHLAEVLRQATRILISKKPIISDVQEEK